jgi:hypothetical protein
MRPTIELFGPGRDARACGKIGCGAVARRGRRFLAQVRPLLSLIRGADVGLRIVATSTRVRLFSIPVRFLGAVALM